MEKIDRTNLAAMDLNLLTALESLLAEGSVGRAAERMRLSQPAMSHALKRLRDLFRDPLLVRVGGRMQLTSVHEASSPAAEPDNAVAPQLLTISNVVSSGSVITSVGQFGGQLAHSITNIVIAPSPSVDLQAVIARKTDPRIILDTLRIRIRNAG